MRKKKRFWPVLGAVGFLCTSFCVCGAQAQNTSADGRLETMAYNVYAGGIRAVQANLDLDLSNPESYHMELSAGTRGFLARLIPWEGRFETQGWHGSDPVPENHRSVARWREESEIKTYTYSKSGNLISYAVEDDGKNTTPETLSDELTDGTIDILTAALRVMNHLEHGETCTGQADVFDGKRRFEILFRHVRHETLQASRYNIYEGPAVMCEVEIVPRGGAWREKPRGWLNIQEQGRALGDLPAVWLAKLSPTGPAIPVRVRVKTQWGTLFAHLASHKTHKLEHSETMTPETMP